MIRSSITDHTIPSNHHGVLEATPKTRRLRMNQCVITISVIITATLIILSVSSRVAPLCTRPNMEESILPAEGKSGDLKNTQVTLTRKKVNSAMIKLGDHIFLRNLGAAIPCIATGSAYCSTNTGSGLKRRRKSWINFSTHKYRPCKAPQTTKVQEAPCHKPPSSIVIMRFI